MPIKRIKFAAKNDCAFRELCQLSLVKDDKDLYFIDKSVNLFHISFHNDDSIWLSANSSEIPSKQLFEASSFPKRTEYVMPFLFYISSKICDYPETKNQKRSATFFVDADKNIENVLIKFFLADNDTTNLNKVRKTDQNIKNIKIEGIKDDGTKVVYTTPFAPFKFENHKIYFDIVPMNLDKDVCLDKARILFCCKPNSKINISDFLQQNTLNIPAPKQGKVKIQELEYDGNKIICMVY